MTDTTTPRHRRRWITLTVLLAAFTLLTLAATELTTLYRTQRQVRNITDAAVLSGATRLTRALDQPGIPEDEIAAAMLEFATRNGLEQPADLVAYYVNTDGNHLAPVGAGISPDTRGIEATATLRARTFLTRTLGLPGWALTHRAVMIYKLVYIEGQDTPSRVW